MLKPIQIESLRKIIDSNCLIVVEGKKDKRILSFLGFENLLDISGKSLEKTVHSIKSRNPELVVILTDFDGEGEAYSKKLTDLLQSNGIKANHPFRKKIKSVLKIIKLEELNSFKKISGEFYGENCAIYDKMLNRMRILRKRKFKSI